MSCDRLPFIILERYTAANYVISQARGDACLSSGEVEGLKDKSVQVLVVDS